MKRIFSLFFAFTFVVLSMSAGEALVNVSVACVRSKPAHSAELVSQQLMGFPVKILSDNGSWSEVETMDGYHGYIINNSLKKKSAAEMAAWRKSPRVVYTDTREGKIMGSVEEALTMCDIVPGVILELTGEGHPDEVTPDNKIVYVGVKLPDGRKGWVFGSDVTTIEKWRDQEYDPYKILEYGQDNIGTPYLWGGLSAKAMDCSGLSWTSYFLNGRILQRDSSKQGIMTSDKIYDWRKLKPGDLLFFGNKSTGKITHVAIYMGDGQYVESSGCVRYNSMDPKSPLHRSSNFLYGLSFANYDFSKAMNKSGLF